MNKVATFGELMLRLTPPGHQRFLQAEAFEATYGGVEANVAVSLANYGLDVKFVSKLPQNEIGQAAVNSLRRYGVDTTMIVRGGNRIGIYYLEKGASQRPYKVIYDRAYSAIAEASASDFDWDRVFEEVSWFHFCGITPALSEECAKLCLLACKKAKEKGITVSFDVNYRKNLWPLHKAKEVIQGLAQYIDVCFANDEDADKIFGIDLSSKDFTKEQGNARLKQAAAKMMETFGFKLVASTVRDNMSASENRWSAMLYDGIDYYMSKKYDMNIIDRVGGGDAFAAGLIYAMVGGRSMQETIEFAAAAGCLKHSIEGDYNLASEEEVQALSSGDGSGRIQR